MIGPFYFLSTADLSVLLEDFAYVALMTLVATNALLLGPTSSMIEEIGDGTNVVFSWDFHRTTRGYELSGVTGL